MNEQDKKLCERLDTWGTLLAMDCKQAIERLSAELAEVSSELLLETARYERELATLRAQPTEQEPVGIALHYPECWDTAAYPTVWDALAEVVSWFRCSNDDCAHPAEDAKDAEIQRLRKVMFDAWDETDWLLIANEVHDMKGAK